nr:MAG TPA: Thymidylate synthase thyX [Caudoviricetes sp.]
MAEHSPIRTGRLIINVYDVPSFVIGHFVRHNQGFTPFVASLRNDRASYNKVPDRNTQNSFRFDGNFQSFINISKKRYCNCASKETREVWAEIMKAVKEFEPELFSVCKKRMYI